MSDGYQDFAQCANAQLCPLSSSMYVLDLTRQEGEQPTEVVTVHTRLLVVAIAAMGVVANGAHAADYYVGQTGQYHTLPYSQDVQKITLAGKNGGPCANVGGTTLYAVDEYGTVESIPFQVPSRTVFVVTDAIFDGYENAGLSGEVAWLNIVQTNVPNAFEKASFLASTPAFSGKANEYFAGQGSLASGAAFAANSTLCARASIHADGGASYYNMGLDSVVVHGELVDDVRTNSYPYFLW